MNIAEIVKNKAEHIALKKATMKFADAWGTPSVLSKQTASKAIDLNAKDASIEIVGNTNNWLDSHGDIHVQGNWNKTIADGGRKFHLHDHKFELMAQVGKINSISEKQIAWRDLGVNKDGFTTSLVANTTIIKELNEKIYKAYASGEIDQHSVGMQYVKLDLAVNPDEYEDEEANKVWNEVYPLIGNPEKADQDKMFWVVRESKLIEISAVLMGSNSLTPTLENKQEPLIDTLDTAAASALQTFYNNLNF